MIDTPIATNSPSMDRYSITEPLATALFGHVDRYVDLQRNNQTVVIKTVHTKDAQNGIAHNGIRVAENPFTEAQLHSTLSHPNIVSLQEVIMENETMYMVMEDCNGGDLFDALKSSAEMSLPKSVVQTSLLQIADALAYIHNRGIAHRDISLENILLLSGGDDTELCCKLSDFGLAVNVKKDVDETRVGKILYMAPEVWGVDTNADTFYEVEDARAADMWSLGILLFIMLTSVPPVDEPNYSDEGFRMIATEGIEAFIIHSNLEEEFTSAFLTLISHLLVVNPSERWNMDQVLEFLKTSSQAVPEVMLSSSSPSSRSRSTSKLFQLEYFQNVKQAAIVKLEQQMSFINDQLASSRYSSHHGKVKEYYAKRKAEFVNSCAVMSSERRVASPTAAAISGKIMKAREFIIQNIRIA